MASLGTVKHMFLNVDTVLEHMLRIQIQEPQLWNYKNKKMEMGI